MTRDINIKGKHYLSVDNLETTKRIEQAMHYLQEGYLGGRFVLNEANSLTGLNAKAIIPNDISTFIKNGCVAMRFNEYNGIRSFEILAGNMHKSPQDFNLERIYCIAIPTRQGFLNEQKELLASITPPHESDSLVSRVTKSYIPPGGLAQL